MNRNQQRQVAWLPLLGSLLAANPATAQIRLPTKPILGTPVAIVPPPTLTGASTMPTRILLTWPPVAGAQGYKVTRTNNNWEPEATISEGAAASFAVDPGLCSGTMPCQYLNTNVWGPYVYSYRVYSIFPGNPPVYSGPGPVATITPAPFVAPANVKHTVVPSTVKLGFVRVTLTWDVVSGATAYYLVADLTTTRGFIYPVTVSSTSLVLDGASALQPRQQYTICVSTIYGANVRNDSVRSCVLVGG